MKNLRPRGRWWVLLAGAVCLLACGREALSAPSTSNVGGADQAYALETAAPADFYGGRKAAGTSPPPAPMAPQPALPPAAAGAEGALQAGMVPPLAPDDAPAAGAARLLIYEATLVLAVFEVAKALDHIETLARESGGYLVRRSDEDITIRVPAAGFQALLVTVAATGDELHREVNVQDVSEQYHDLAIQLNNAEAVLARLRTLMERAEDVKSALAVEEQLARVAEQVERLKGQLRRLQELIAFSTLTVRFQSRASRQASTDFELPFEWLHRVGLPHLLDLERQ